MKKVIHFSRFFVPFTLMSAVIIIAGLVMGFTKGINYGIDFKAGLVEEVTITPVVLDLTYSGPAAVTAEAGLEGITLVVSGIGADNTTYTYSYSEYPTVGDLVSVINTIEGVTATAIAAANTPVVNLVSDSSITNVLSSNAYGLHSNTADAISVDAVRDALSVIEGVEVKAVGLTEENRFQIRVGDDGTDSAAIEKFTSQIKEALSATFGEANLAVNKTDFIGSRFSSSLATQSIFVLTLTLFFILAYCTFRFKWDFAVGAVLAIVHDALIMFAFIVFTQMEFTTITIAAMLTIIGYSINDTIVVLDRVREKIATPNLKVNSFKQVLDTAQTEIFSRTIITTVTTMLAVISLFIFTTGSMKDFALALLVGMISGVYSTIFISGSFIAKMRKNWKPSDEEKHASGTLKVTI